MPAITVLLVDDNAILAEAMPRLLEGDRRFAWAGWVSNGTDVLSQVSCTSPDVVLMDVDMPGVDTFGLVRQLVAGCARTKVVMFSGHIRDEYTDAAFDAGASGYLHKDDEFPALLECLERVHRGELVLSPLVQRALWRG